MHTIQTKNFTAHKKCAIQFKKIKINNTFCANNTLKKLFTQFTTVNNCRSTYLPKLSPIKQHLGLLGEHIKGRHFNTKPCKSMELMICGSQTSKIMKSVVTSLGIFWYIYLHRMWQGNRRRKESDTCLAKTHMYIPSCTFYICLKFFHIIVQFVY